MAKINLDIIYYMKVTLQKKPSLSFRIKKLFIAFDSVTDPVTSLYFGKDLDPG